MTDELSMSDKILATPAPQKRVTATDRAVKFEELAGRFERQILEDDFEAFRALRESVKALKGNSPTSHEAVTNAFDQMGDVRLRWQAARIFELGSTWLKAKAAVGDRASADAEFVNEPVKAFGESGPSFKGAIDAWMAMPSSNKDERQAKLSRGFEIMDALRAPLGRCPKCVEKKAKRPGELTVNERTGKPYALCAQCHREQRMAGGSAHPASPSAASTRSQVFNAPVEADDNGQPKAKPNKPNKRGKHGPKGEKGRKAAAAKKSRKTVKKDGESKKQRGKSEEGRKSRRESVESDE